MTGMSDTDLDHHAENALHAAQTWISRMGADHTAVVVVTIAPTASVGIWLAGQVNVGQLPLGDAEAELCEAAAPLAQGMFDMLTPSAREITMDSVDGGARLQLVLSPAASDATLRLLAGDKCVDLVKRHAGTVV